MTRYTSMTEFASVLDDLAARARGDAIFVLGKGASADAIDRSALATGLTINLNDSFLVYAGDVSLFHHDWVADKLAALRSSRFSWPSGVYTS